MSDGIWMMPGGAKSVVIEFRDHVMVVDAPESEERSIAVMEATKKVVPAKPIGYVVNFLHPAGQQQRGARRVVNLVHFYQAVERLRLEVEQIIPIHGRLVTMDDLRAAVTSFGNTQIWER